MLTAPLRAREQSRSSRLTYRPALDGLRALAVMAVFAYHAGLPWARAGFLGVDVFFVLSGYLITALLVTEHSRHLKIDLLRFWSRRARRLLPAVVVLLAAVALLAPLLATDQLHRLRGDLLAALGYVSNWRLIFENQSYFEAVGRPPLLQHLWSLAVEEQFYLVWPVVLAVALRRRTPRRLVRPLLLAAAGSAVLMAVLFEPYTDPSRVYYGTDTRAAPLLIGAALACATTRWQRVDCLRLWSRRGFDLAGLLALGGLAWTVSSLSEFDPRLYQGGFLAVAVAAAALVATSARPGPPAFVGRVLAASPMVWLGRRSYAVYLWFWPVLLLTRPHLDVPVTGLPLLALRVAITLVLAAVTYGLVERPARAGAVGRAWADARRAWSTRSPVSQPTAVVGLAAALLAVAVGSGVLLDHRSRTAPFVLESAAANTAAPTIPAPSVAPTTTTPAPAPTEPATTVGTVPPTTVAATPVSLPTVTARVMAIGDSVLLGAKPVLEQQIDGLMIDAAVARQFPAILAAARAYRDSGELADVVVVQTGNNGPINPSQFDELLETFSGVAKVLVVNVKVDRAWQDFNNEIFAEGVKRFPNARLLDWHGVASAESDVFYDDGLHLTATGRDLFAQLLLSAM